MFLKNNTVKWIKPTDDVCLQSETNEFENLAKTEDMPIQSALPLGNRFSHYKATLLEVSNDGQGASVGIASCSPLKPTYKVTFIYYIFFYLNICV